MRLLLSLALLFFGSLAPGLALQDEQNEAADIDPATITAEQIIPLPVSSWNTAEIPADFPLPGLDLQVTAADPLAAAHVVAGIHYLHLFWDQEAMRHFAAALELDPDCPLAWWGIAMSLLPEKNEFVEQRNLALLKLPLLRGLVRNPWEAELIDMLLVFPVQGVPGAINQLDRLLKLKPGDLNATCLKANFMRGGYATDGQPLPDLRRSQQLVAGLIRDYGSHPIVLHYALRVTFPAPRKSLWLAEKVLDRFPQPLPSPYLYYESAQLAYLLGRYEDAQTLSHLGMDQAETWLIEAGADLADCPTLIDLNELYVLASLERGQLNLARHLARQISRRTTAEGRTRSAGTQAMLHRGVLLPALVEERFGNWERALEQLPSYEGSLDPLDLAPWSWQAQRFYDQGQLAADQGDVPAVREAHGNLGELAAHYQEFAPEAVHTGERMRWHHEQRVLEQLSLQLLARIAELEHKPERTYLRLRSAIDARERTDPSAPPLSVPSVRELLGNSAAHFGDADLARRAFVQALSGPAINQAPSWLGLSRAFLDLSDQDRAAAALQRFETAWEQADREDPLLVPYFEEADKIRAARE